MFTPFKWLTSAFICTQLLTDFFTTCQDVPNWCCLKDKTYVNDVNSFFLRKKTQQKIDVNPVNENITSDIQCNLKSLNQTVLNREYLLSSSRCVCSDVRLHLTWLQLYKANAKDPSSREKTTLSLLLSTFKKDVWAISIHFIIPILTSRSRGWIWLADNRFRF